MADHDKYDSNGDYGGYPDNFKRSNVSDKMDDSQDRDNDNEESANPAAQKAGEYVRELLAEKLSIDQNKHPNAAKLIEQEITKVQATGKVPLREFKYVDIYREKPIKVTVKVLVPVREHPKFNFVGKLLGPKGNSMKRLQEETMCKMAVLGRGSMKDRAKEDELRNSLDPKYAHLADDLHVEISALGPPAEAHARIAFALAEVRKYLIPDNNDNIRQEQMREMEIITGTDPQVDDRGGMPRRPPPPQLRSGGMSRPPMQMRTATRQPVSTPRVMPAKTKIMSILDRARMAMEESYGFEEPYEPIEPSNYEPYSSSMGHNRSNYTPTYNPEYEPAYFRDTGASSYDNSSPRWKYKTPGPAAARHPDPSRYRSSPYTRPNK